MARLMATSLRLLLDEMHRRLAELGYHGLRPVYGFALNGVGDGTTTAELAKHLGMTKQGAAKLVTTLVAEGYLATAPHEHDKRATLLTVTPRGRALMKAAVAVQGTLEAELAEKLGTGDVEAARRLMTAVVDEYGANAPSALGPSW